MPLASWRGDGSPVAFVHSRIMICEPDVISLPFRVVGREDAGATGIARPSSSGSPYPNRSGCDHNTTSLPTYCTKLETPLRQKTTTVPNSPQDKTNG